MSLTTISPALAVIDGIPTTTSTQVAEHFGKLHKDVLKAIRGLGCTTGFYERNFAPIQIDVDLGLGRTRQDPAFRLTRNGFTFLAMGFTGPEADRFKEAYIEEFDRMEAALRARPARPSPAQHMEAATMFKALLKGYPADQANRLSLAATGVDVMAITGYLPPVRVSPTPDRLLDILANTESTKDQRFAHVVRRGLMPYSLLMKKMKSSAAEFRVLLDEAISAGTVQQLDGEIFGYAGACIKLVEAV